MSPAAIRANGTLSPPPTEKATSTPSTPAKVVLAGKTGRILCVADIRGDYHELNRLIREHEATAVIHTGDFGFMTQESVDRMGDKILRHLIQYSPLISPATRTQLLGIPSSSGRGPLVEQLNASSVHFPLSQFPHLLSGAINFPVPVFTVWGLIEDVRVLEKFRTGEYEVQNLSIIDETTTKLVEVGGMKLRLFGLGGTVAPHKMLNSAGEGYATIAGGQGTMWTTALQMGELIDTAQRVYDDTETRLFISSAPMSRTGLLSLIANELKADLSISGGLHFRYPVSFNDFSIHGDYESYRHKLQNASNTFSGVYETVKDKVDSSLSESQKALLKKIVNVANKIPKQDDTTWTNTWHWVLSDASCGHMLLSITDSRVSAEIKTSGLNFAHRSGKGPIPPSGPIPASTAAPLATASRRPDVPEPSAVKTATPTRAPLGPGGPPTAAKPGQPSNTATVAPAGSFKTGPGRPTVPSAKSTTPSSSTTPATASAFATSAMAAKPPTQPRGLRGQPPTTAPGATLKDKPVEGSKSTLIPTAASKKDDKAPPAAPAKSVTPSIVSGKATPPTDKKDEVKKTPTPAPGPNGDSKEASAGAKEEGKHAHSREGSGEVRPKKHSLYIKGIPVPTTEEELKGLFGNSGEKAVQAKIIADHITKKQKDFGYVDFATEEDMNEALKQQKGTIRDTSVTVSISNPPVRPSFTDGFRGGRGRGGSFRGGRGRGFGSISGGSFKRDGGAGGEGGSGGGEKKEGGGGGEKKE
ncbi:hypothetical protein I316_03335 [Kwoniella heveanensis BCC8398]|uniref:RRM domain-containing protein n=1 Tax=Kwoniella heveanensis BCC8398 TaxID=1296120 RepID=A0A1B9GUT2_9TREE|nr:hypothetical protein I316_03335 [Kwoniella heveanensis BCC8398]